MTERPDTGKQENIDERSTLDSHPLQSAGFLRRVVATLADMVIFAALSAALLLPLSSAIEWTISVQHIDELARDLSDPSWLGHASGILGLWVAMWWSYFVVGWGLFGATPGKWMLGLRVIDHRGRCPIGGTRALLRLVAYSVSSITLCWGHLLAIVRKDKRTLHDILAGTRVVTCASLKRHCALGHRCKDEAGPRKTNEEPDCQRR